MYVRIPCGCTDFCCCFGTSKLVFIPVDGLDNFLGKWFAIICLLGLGKSAWLRDRNSWSCHSLLDALTITPNCLSLYRS